MFQEIIFKNLFIDKGFARKVLPHVKEEYFDTPESKQLYSLIREYVVNYKSLPTYSSVKVEASQLPKLTERGYENLSRYIDDVEQMTTEEWDQEWLITNTEKFCQERALTNAILGSVELMEAKKNVGAIPELIRSALQVGFQSSVGLEFLDDVDIEERWERYHRKTLKIPTGIDKLDSVTGGGYEKKALICTLGQTNAGKSAQMINFGCSAIRNGYNVLYVTLEMAEEKITQRFEANLLDVEINDVPLMGKKNFVNKLTDLKSKTYGRLVVKEFPTSCCDVNRLRALLDELKIKKGFSPDVIIVDYLNLMNSVRMKSDNMYSVVKSIAEELRGLAVEGDYCIVTGTQINRGGFNSSDIDMTDTSESMGLTHTLDFMLGTIFPEELREQNIQIWKVLKNRFGGIVNFKIPVAVDFAKSRFTNLDEACDLVQNSESNVVLARNEDRRQKSRNAFVVKKEDKKDLGTEDLLNMLTDDMDGPPWEE